MKVCCGTGKPHDTLTEIERIGGCGTDHCIGLVELENYLLETCGTFDTNDCISHEDMRHLFSKPDSWKEWIATQIEQEGIEQYKQWYGGMLERNAVCDELIEAHNGLFKGEKE